MPRLALIVAMAENGVIGRANALPWHLPEDLKRFKALTMGHAIIMGRLTHESIGRALPGRRNIVVTQRLQNIEGCEVAESLGEALGLGWRTDEMPFVIGGARLYRAALPQATHLFVTHVMMPAEGDVFFPSIDWSEWEVLHETISGQVRFVDYVRRSA